MKINPEYAVLHEVWRKALQQPDGVAIPCKTQAQATRLRFALYNSVKMFRAGKATPDQELGEALRLCSIGFTPDKTGLTLRRKVLDDLFQQLTAITGDPEQLLSTDERLEQEAAQRFVARMQLPAPETRAQAQPQDELTQIYGARS